jgi:amino acid permease
VHTPNGGLESRLRPGLAVPQSPIVNFDCQSDYPVNKLNKQWTHSPRRLTLVDTTLLVLGGIIGTGIFFNSSNVAERVHTPA